MSNLAQEIDKFRRWAVLYSQPEYNGPKNHGAEWECDYPDWESLYLAVEEFLRTTQNRRLTENELTMLLYAMARDNEDERILQTLEKFSNVAMQVARTAVSYPEIDARWQAAVLLGHFTGSEVVALLKEFLADDAEYVRRRAKSVMEEMTPETN